MVAILCDVCGERMPMRAGRGRPQGAGLRVLVQNDDDGMVATTKGMFHGNHWVDDVCFGCAGKVRVCVGVKPSLRRRMFGGAA